MCAPPFELLLVQYQHSGWLFTQPGSALTSNADRRGPPPPIWRGACKWKGSSHILRALELILLIALKKGRNETNNYMLIAQKAEVVFQASKRGRNHSHNAALSVSRFGTQGQWLIYVRCQLAEKKPDEERGEAGWRYDD